MPKKKLKKKSKKSKNNTGKGSGSSKPLNDQTGKNKIAITLQNYKSYLLDHKYKLTYHFHRNDMGKKLSYWPPGDIKNGVAIIKSRENYFKRLAENDAIFLFQTYEHDWNYESNWDEEDSSDDDDVNNNNPNEGKKKRRRRRRKRKKKKGGKTRKKRRRRRKKTKKRK